MAAVIEKVKNTYFMSCKSAPAFDDMECRNDEDFRLLMEGWRQGWS